MEPHESERLTHRRPGRHADHLRRRLSGLHREQGAQRNAFLVEHLVFAHPLVAVQFREVPFSRVAEKRHDTGLRVVHAPRDVQCDMRDQSRRPAGEKTLLPSKSTRHRKRIPIADALKLVYHCHVQGVGNLVLADSLNFVRHAVCLVRAPAPPVFGEN